MKLVAVLFVIVCSLGCEAHATLKTADYVAPSDIRPCVPSQQPCRPGELTDREFAQARFFQVRGDGIRCVVGYVDDLHQAVHCFLEVR